LAVHTRISGCKIGDMSPDVTPQDASPPSPGGQRLSGWKEIAAHLGKGVRTVQRWEQVYGLPIHRMGQEGGEIVWADATELDAWVRAQSRVGTTGPADLRQSEVIPPAPTRLVEPNVDQVGQTAQRPLAAVSRPYRNWAIAAGVGLLAIAGAAAFQASRATPPEAVDWAIQGQAMVGLAADGQVVWSYPFPAPVDPSVFNRASMDRPGSRVLRRDIDGDGRLETMIAFSDGARPTVSGFHLLSPDGVPLIPPIRPTDSVTFGTTVYPGPWTAHKLFVTTTESGETRLHVVFIDLSQFPTLLLTLDRHGTVLSKYLSNGYIDTVNTGVRNGKRVWLVGATHNDTQGASLAIFNAEPSGSAPASQDAYVCRDGCPAGTPAAFLVLPRLCMAPAWTVNGTATITEAYTDASGLLFAHVREGTFGSNGLPGSEVIYSFDSSLTQVSAEVTTGLLVTHRDLERQGLLKHAWSTPEEDTLFPALLWTGERFVPLPRGKVTY